MPSYHKNRSNNKLSPAKIVGIITTIVGLIVFGIILISKKPITTSEITKDQVLMEKDGQIVIVNKNGLVEYRSKDGIFFETWDSFRIDSFFTSITQKAKKYLETQKSSANCGSKYKVFLYIDGELVSVCVDEDDKEIQEIFSAIDAGASGGNNISDLFDDLIGDGEGGGSIDGGSTSTPIPTTSQSGFTPTPTPYNSGGSTNYPPVSADCEGWSKDIVKGRAIISNTYCVVPSPTP